MNILWVINVPMPEVSQLLGIPTNPYGGWLVGACDAISNCGEVNLSVAFPWNTSEIVRGKKVTYYPFSTSPEDIERVIKATMPDIVQVWGTENAHSYDFIKHTTSHNIKTIVYIQGLISVCAKHYFAGLPNRIIRKYTFRDLIKQENIAQQQTKFAIRGKSEIESLQMAKYIIGRTALDKACSNQINPRAIYFHCNETLRGEFYKHAWKLENCERHSIFLSQGNYPIKGLHYVIESMPTILERFPDAKLYVAGDRIIGDGTLLGRLKLTSYGKYIRTLIKKRGLTGKVLFTGRLNEAEMCERYLKSHVFVCPSSIENSPNSLGEAMILGVPCVAASVGGIMDMMDDGEDGLIYRAGDVNKLSNAVCEIFSDDNRAKWYSQNAIVHAKKTHDPQTNSARLLEIYREVMGHGIIEKVI